MVFPIIAPLVFKILAAPVCSWCFDLLPDLFYWLRK